MAYTRRQIVRVEYVLDAHATPAEVTAASLAIAREAGAAPVTFEMSSDRSVLHFDREDTR